jgi:hypothetical protein
MARVLMIQNCNHDILEWVVVADPIQTLNPLFLNLMD